MRGLVGNYYIKVDTESRESIRETSMSLKDAGITRVCVSFRRRDDHGEYENVKSKGHKDKATAM